MAEDDERRKIQTETVYRYVCNLQIESLSLSMEITKNSKCRGMVVKPSLHDEMQKILKVISHSLSVMTATIVSADGCLSTPLQLDAKAVHIRCEQFGLQLYSTCSKTHNWIK